MNEFKIFNLNFFIHGEGKLTLIKNKLKQISNSLYLNLYFISW